MVWRAEPGGGATVGIFPDKFLAFLPGSLRCQMVDRGHKVMSGILIIELFQLQNTAHCTAAVLLWWGNNNNTWPGVQEDRRSRPESVLQYIVSRLNETSSSLIRWLTNKLCLLLLQSQAASLSQFTGLCSVWDSVYYCNIIWRVLAGWPPIGSRWPLPPPSPRAPSRENPGQIQNTPTLATPHHTGTTTQYCTNS